ncbi:hypothetical protein [Spirosoma gilvum]
MLPETKQVTKGQKPYSVNLCTQPSPIPIIDIGWIEPWLVLNPQPHYRAPQSYGAPEQDRAKIRQKRAYPL